MYIVDAARRPVGAITVTDVIRLVLSPTIIAYDFTPEFAPAGPVKLTAELFTLLQSTTASSFIVRDGVRIDKLVDVPHDASATGALATLAEHNLSAVPVYRLETGRRIDFEFVWCSNLGQCKH